MEKKIIIIPDVHGRTFWRDAVNFGIENNIRIVFLGDYLDCYPSEGITPEDAITVFKEILQLKKDNPDKITLLVGNHDLEYWNTRMEPCRCDLINFKAIREMFMADKDNFKLVDEETINSKHFFFSHAGITKGWLKEVKEYYNPEDFELNCDKINELFHNDKLWRALSQISFKRGGDNDFGSIVWADVTEHINGEQIEDFIQIFAHSMLRVNGLKVNDYTYCLDAKKAFYIDENGVVRDFETNEEPFILSNQKN